jgi:hypothetical protein
VAEAAKEPKLAAGPVDVTGMDAINGRESVDSGEKLIVDRADGAVVDVIDPVSPSAADAAGARGLLATGHYPLTTSSPAVPIVPRAKITIRPGTLDDLPFIDRLQKADSRALGFLPWQALVGKVELGQVLVACASEGVDSGQLLEASADGGEEGVAREAEWPVASADGAGVDVIDAPSPPSAVDAGTRAQLATRHSSLTTPAPRATGHSPLATPPTPVGYIIAADRYQKRDEIGYVTQVNVLPGYRRHLVAAALLQAQFDRSATGCKLYCCWCAQDLPANAFWEAMGFVPIAFRAGAAKGRRVAGGEGVASGGEWPVASADGAGNGAVGSASLRGVGGGGGGGGGGARGPGPLPH